MTGDTWSLHLTVTTLRQGHNIKISGINATLSHLGVFNPIDSVRKTSNNLRCGSVGQWRLAREI